jgi:hypothetical protein
MKPHLQKPVVFGRHTTVVVLVWEEMGEPFPLFRI